MWSHHWRNLEWNSFSIIQSSLRSPRAYAFLQLKSLHLNWHQNTRYLLNTKGLSSAFCSSSLLTASDCSNLSTCNDGNRAQMWVYVTYTLHSLDHNIMCSWYKTLSQAWRCMLLSTNTSEHMNLTWSAFLSNYFYTNFPTQYNIPAQEYALH